MLPTLLLCAVMTANPLHDGEVFFGEPSAPRVVGHGVAVFSITNDNSRFIAVVELSEVPTVSPALMLGGQVLRASGTGSGFQGRSPGSATFELNATLAEALATAWKLEPRRRVPLGEGLTARLKLAGEYRRGEPMRVELEVTNRGAERMFVSVGGRQRGPRDNRFHFSSPHATALPDAPDFGGLMTYRELAPGGTLTVTEDLTRWLRFEASGPVTVDASYEAEVVTSREGARWPEAGHHKWDLVLYATGTTTLR